MNAVSTMKRGRPESDTALRFRRWGNGACSLLLVGYLIFCHGCHGEDIDDELSVPQLRNRPLKSTEESTPPSGESRRVASCQNPSERGLNGALPSASPWRRD